MAINTTISYMAELDSTQEVLRSASNLFFTMRTGTSSTKTVIDLLRQEIAGSTIALSTFCGRPPPLAIAMQTSSKAYTFCFASASSCTAHPVLNGEPERPH